MNIDQTLEQLAHLQYPRQVDVVDRVMAQVAARPYLQPVHRSNPLWKRFSAVAAAAVVVLVAINVTSLYTRSYDEEGMGNTLAQLNDYSSWSTVEQVASPYEYLYEE